MIRNLDRTGFTNKMIMLGLPKPIVFAFIQFQFGFQLSLSICIRGYPIFHTQKNCEIDRILMEGLKIHQEL